jgi:hypothetical protein
MKTISRIQSFSRKPKETGTKSSRSQKSGYIKRHLSHDEPAESFGRCSQGKSDFGTVMVQKDGKLPIPAPIVADLGLQSGDLVGFRQLERGKLEITFWRRLAGKNWRFRLPPSLPDWGALVELPQAKPRKRILIPAYVRMMKQKPRDSTQADLDAMRSDR